MTKLHVIAAAVLWLVAGDNAIAGDYSSGQVLPPIKLEPPAPTRPPPNPINKPGRSLMLGACTGTLTTTVTTVTTEKNTSETKETAAPDFRVNVDFDTGSVFGFGQLIPITHADTDSIFFAASTKGVNFNRYIDGSIDRNTGAVSAEQSSWSNGRRYSVQHWDVQCKRARGLMTQEDITRFRILGRTGPTGDDCWGHGIGTRIGDAVCTERGVKLITDPN
jgi:hypothetical protein